MTNIDVKGSFPKCQQVSILEKQDFTASCFRTVVGEEYGLITLHGALWHPGTPIRETVT